MYELFKPTLTPRALGFKKQSFMWNWIIWQKEPPPTSHPGWVTLFSGQLYLLHQSLGSWLSWCWKGWWPRKFCYKQMKQAGWQTMAFFCSKGREEIPSYHLVCPWEVREGPRPHPICSSELSISKALRGRGREDMEMKRITGRSLKKKKRKQGWGFFQIILISRFLKSAYRKVRVQIV